jgi:crotonobetainyl-CoA:carnitine CoA-transferase CaiB-like acyl-CoA transferase
MATPLGGIRVVDLSTTTTGAHISQTLADFGGDVVMVEPPGGNPLRTQAAWPFWARGKRSVVLDLGRPDDLATAVHIAADADVVIDTWRPGVAERLGLGYEQLAERNPRVVVASVTGFGRDNRYSHLKAWEPIVMAKIGGLDAFSGLSDRPGPSYVAAPYCSFSASQLALQGIMAALYERESSGMGQRVDTTLVQGVLAHDTWNWLLRKVMANFGGAFTAAPPTDQARLVPHSALFFRLMVGYSRDGRYMQFSQTTERLWQAFLDATGLRDVMATRPGWKDAPNAEDPDVRVAFWEEALARTRERTYEEWLGVFDEHPDVWAEMFRSGTELLHHPQMQHDDRTETVVDPVVGAVLQPGPIARMHTTPAELSPARVLDADGDAIRGQSGASSSTSPRREASPSSVDTPPLHGVTVIELGTFYAAPFGTTILADLGARVIKIEQHDGDPIRHIMPFPEVGGVKVLQGKESVAVDIASETGREIVLDLVRRADVVLQSFRAGVAQRHGYTAADLLAVNPDLVYVNAPGYGTDGPCGHRPAFAPTIGAGSGLGYRNVGGPQNVPQGPDLTMEEVKKNSMRLSGATMTLGHADGFASLGVGTALVLGLLARRRGAPGQELSTSMLSTLAHTLAEDMVEYEGRRTIPVPDAELHGLGPLWRLYATSDGWVFLAVADDDDWTALAKALELDPNLRAEPERLIETLSTAFAGDTAAAWEETLTAVDVACVEVATGPVEEVVWFSGGMGAELGITTTQHHPIFEEYERLTPLVSFTRSTGVAGPAPMCGDHTEAVLAELGFDDAGIASLRDTGVIL